MGEAHTEPTKGITAVLKTLSTCLNKVVDAVKGLKSDPLKYSILMGIVFIISVVSSRAVFNDLYITGFISLGILFLGYMGFITYNRDQERKVLERINGRLQAMAEEIAAKRAHPGKKNGRL